LIDDEKEKTIKTLKAQSKKNIEELIDVVTE
jgi:hypothetical protein